MSERWAKRATDQPRSTTATPGTGLHAAGYLLRDDARGHPAHGPMDLRRAALDMTMKDGRRRTFWRARWPIRRRAHATPVPLSTASPAAVSPTPPRTSAARIASLGPATRRMNLIVVSMARWPAGSFIVTRTGSSPPGRSKTWAEMKTRPPWPRPARRSTEQVPLSVRTSCRGWSLHSSSRCRMSGSSGLATWPSNPASMASSTSCGWA